MPQRVNVILAGGVLLLGLAGASLFRRASPGDSSRPSEATSDSSRTAQITSEDAGRAYRLGVGRGTVASTVLPTAVPSYYARQPDSPHPPLPRPLHAPSVLDKLGQTPFAPTAPESSPRYGLPESPPGGGPPRTHIIADGDTLAGLAAWYLGDPQRSAEIFEANRGVLADPEALPLGTKLTIPPR